jgi:hypothetical protein
VQKIKSERHSDGVELKQPDIEFLMKSIHISDMDTTIPDNASRYVLHPNAYMLRNVWDPLQRLLAILYFLEVPFSISFHPERSFGAPAAATSAPETTFLEIIMLHACKTSRHLYRADCAWHMPWKSTFRSPCPLADKLKYSKSWPYLFRQNTKEATKWSNA